MQGWFGEYEKRKAPLIIVLTKIVNQNTCQSDKLLLYAGYLVLSESSISFM
jgi:hypothetical protein